METIVKSEKKEAKISFEAPFTIIGEKINPTGRKKLAAALKEGNYDYVKQIATRQVEIGADILDINVGVPGIDEVAVLPEVAKLVSELVDVPLCLDSSGYLPSILSQGSGSSCFKPKEIFFSSDSMLNTFASTD